METTVGERLKGLVREKGLEQRQAAEQLKIKIPTFNGYVSNNREPSIVRLIQMAEYFNVTIDYLIGYSDIKDPYMKYLPEKIRTFIQDPDNQTYIELAMDIKERTGKTKNKIL